jgi:hypothetical protein
MIVLRCSIARRCQLSSLIWALLLRAKLCNNASSLKIVDTSSSTQLAFVGMSFECVLKMSLASSSSQCRHSGTTTSCFAAMDDTPSGHGGKDPNLLVLDRGLGGLEQRACFAVLISACIVAFVYGSCGAPEWNKALTRTIKERVLQPCRYQRANTCMPSCSAALHLSASQCLVVEFQEPIRPCHIPARTPLPLSYEAWSVFVSVMHVRF